MGRVEPQTGDAPAIHPLRQRMIEDMSMRGLAAATHRNYLRVVRACAKATSPLEQPAVTTW